MRVRQATAVDLPVLVPLFDSYRQFYGQPADAPRAYAFLAERFLRAESVVFLAFDRAQAIGFVQLYPSFSSIRTAPLIILNDLYVAHAARRAGAGQALVEAATAHAKAQGAAGLILSTATTNTPAQALYERLGWMRETGFYEYALTLA